METLTEVEDRARLTLDALLRHRGLSISEMARRTGYTRQSLGDKVHGGSRVSLRDLEVFAPALGVELTVFLLEPDDAIRWAIDHRTDERPPTPMRRRAASGKEIALTTWNYHSHAAA